MLAVCRVDARLTCSQELWGTVPMFPKHIGEQEKFHVFLKIIWGTGVVHQVPQKVFGEHDEFPKFLKIVLGNIWGGFGEQAR